MTGVTKKAPNSFDSDLGRLKPPVSSTYPVIAPLSFSCHPGSLILMGGHSLTENHGIEEGSTKGALCKYIFCTVTAGCINC